MRRLFVAGLALVAVACKGSGTGATGAGADAAADAARPCHDPSASPTRSIALTAWPASNAVDGAALGSGTDTALSGAPAGVVATSDGYVFVALGSSAVGVLRQAGGALAPTSSLTLPEAPFGLGLSRDGAMLAASLHDAVALIDVAKLEGGANDALVATVPTHAVKGSGIDVAFSADGGFVFVAVEYDRAVAVVDVKQRAYVGAIPIAGNAVTGVVVSPDGKRLYATCEVADEFLAANPSPAADQLVGRVVVADVPRAKTDPAGSVIAQAFVGRAPVRAAVSPDGATLWLTARGSNSLVALDTANLVSGRCDPYLSSTAVGAAPVGLAVTSDGASVLVADSNRFAAPGAPQSVSLVDTARALAASPDAIKGHFSVGAFPREIAIAGTQAFVTNYNSKSISLLSLAP